MTTFRVTDGGKSLRIEIRPEGVLVEIDSGCGTCSVVMSHEKAREAVGWIFDRTPVMGAAPPGPLVYAVPASRGRCAVRVLSAPEGDAR